MKLIKALFILLTISAYSQDNFIPATLTTINGDEIKGELNYQDWKKTPEKIEFKVGGTVKEYLPGDVKSFQVESDKFIARKVTLDVTEQRLQKMDKSLKTKFEDRYIFLNVLAEGTVNLYEFYGIRPHYFAEKGSEFQELIKRESFAENNRDLIINRKYIGQLRVFLNDCNTVNIKETLAYKRKELSKLVNNYNACVNKDGDAVYAKNLNTQKSRFYVTAGYSSSSVSMSGTSPFIRNFEGGNFSSPTIGVGYEIMFSKNRSKWSMYNELTYSNIDYKESNDVTNTTILYDNFNVKYSVINLNVFFRYKFHKEGQKVTPFANIGLGRSFTFSMDNTVDRIDVFNNRLTTRKFETRTGYFTNAIGVGAIYNKFSFELRYNRSEKIAKGSISTMNISHLGLMVSYRLK